MKYADPFIRRVNEIFHDHEQGAYESRHMEIFTEQADRWKRVGRRFVQRPERTCLLDVGCGTGFVAIQLGPMLKKRDLLVCSDISAMMLRRCQDNLAARRLECAVEFLKGSGDAIGRPDKTFDAITFNSTVHHVPDLRRLFAEVDRLLAPGGCVIMGHEPNRAFFTHPILWPNYRLVSLVCNPRTSFGEILRRAGLIDPARRLARRFSGSMRGYQQIVDAVNAQLLAEGLLRQPLTPDEVTAIVDVHSPTAGGYDPARGIDLGQLRSQHLPGYVLEHFETYDHLAEATAASRFTRHYDGLLRRRFPQAGSKFLAVLRKRCRR